VVLHSLGRYKSLDGQITFEGHYSDIVLRLVFFMIRGYLKEPDIGRYIIDISSGHNIYTSALIEALRYFCVWLKLYRWGEGIPDLEIAISEPVIPGIETDHRIYFERLDTKAMFSSPVSREDIMNYNLSKIIYPSREDGDRKRSLQDLLTSFAHVFSSIKNNVPLMLYQEIYHDEDEIIEVMSQLIRNGERGLTCGYRRSPGLNKMAYIKCLLASGFYAGLIRILKKYEVQRSPDGVDLKVIRERFREIYRIFHLMLNDTVLGNEIDKLSKDIDSATEWTPLIKCLRNSGSAITQPQKRNFFAHAGFEKNITECKVSREGNKRIIYVRYLDEHVRTIKKWLLEALNE